MQKVRAAIVELASFEVEVEVPEGIDEWQVEERIESHFTSLSEEDLTEAFSAVEERIVTILSAHPA